MKIRCVLFLPVIFIILLTGCATTSIIDAIWKDDLNAVRYIIDKDKSKVNERADNGETPLHRAAYRGHIEMVKYLVLQGAYINDIDNDGYTPLHITSYEGDIELMKYLISNGANVNAKDNIGETPLHIAAEYGHLETVKYLVSQGVNLNSRDNDEQTPLHEAAEGYGRQIEVVKYLLAHGAEVNAKDENGKTPLHMASNKGNFEFVKCLVSKGARFNIKDHYDETPLNYAQRKGFVEIVAFLLSQNQLISKQSQTKPVESHEAKSKKLLSDNSPPVIIITSHDTSRGIKLKENKKIVTIKGRAIDINGIAAVIVNNTDATVDKAGNFSANIFLAKGSNEILVSAKDTYKNRSTKTFMITREDLKPFEEDKITKSLSGKYYALIIGNNSYKYIRKLETAINDAKAVKDVLNSRYGFETQLLLDATRNEIVRAINNYRKILTENDNLIIYYAGHGEYDKTANKAYWLPIDARSDDDTNWILSDRITSNIKRFSAKHVLIVADSCYSGTLTRRAVTDLTSGEMRIRYLQKMKKKASRTLLASGGNEPVSDIGGKGHSIFAEAFIMGLKDIEQSEFTAEELYYQHIKERVAGNAEQTPEYNIIRNSGHYGGDFIFNRIR